MRSIKGEVIPCLQTFADLASWCIFHIAQYMSERHADLAITVHCQSTKFSRTPQVTRGMDPPGQVVVWAEHHEDALDAIIDSLDGRAVQQSVDGVQDPGRQEAEVPQQEAVAVDALQRYHLILHIRCCSHIPNMRRDGMHFLHVSVIAALCRVNAYENLSEQLGLVLKSTRGMQER